MEITELRREDEKAWDEYVLKTEHSTFYHQLRSVLIKLFQSLMLAKRGGEDIQAQTCLFSSKRRSGYEVLGKPKSVL